MPPVNPLHTWVDSAGRLRYNTAMGEEHPRRHRHKRFRSWKRLKLILLVVGATGLFLSAMLAALWLKSGNRKLAIFAAVYVAVSLAFLVLRGIVSGLDRWRKRKYRKAPPVRNLSSPSAGESPTSAE